MPQLGSYFQQAKFANWICMENVMDRQRSNESKVLKNTNLDNNKCAQKIDTLPKYSFGMQTT